MMMMLGSLIIILQRFFKPLMPLEPLEEVHLSLLYQSLLKRRLLKRLLKQQETRHRTL